MSHHRNREVLQTAKIGLMRIGDQRLVLDDEHPDHGDATVTVTTEPYDTSAVSRPPCRLTT